MNSSKQCFFIAPIGEGGSDTRERSDNLMKYVVDDAVSDYGYSVTRADQMNEPGSITTQIIQKTVNSDLVIADLTDHNPNVFYELAVRHATGRPCIQLINNNDTIPFDISDLRTVKYGLEVQEAEQAREDIQSQLESIEEDGSELDNPISRSAEMKSLRESSDPTDQNLADVLQNLSNINQRLSRIESKFNSESHSSLSDFESNKSVVEIGGMQLQVEDGKVPREVVLDVAEKANRDSENIVSYLEAQGIDLV